MEVLVKDVEILADFYWIFKPFLAIFLADIQPLNSEKVSISKLT